MAALEKQKPLDDEKQMESLRRLADPNYSGPGTWQWIHCRSGQIKDYNDMVSTIKFIEFIIENLKCAKCKTHAQEYIKNHPIRACLDCKHQHHTGGMEHCVFEWSCNFHNSVNIRLGKPVIRADIAWNFYAEPEFEVCNTDCDNAEHSGHQHTVVKTPVMAPSYKVDSYEAKVTPPTTTYFAKSVPFRLLSRK